MTNLTRALRPLVLLVAFVAAGCKATTGSDPGPTPITAINGVINCTQPSLWKTFTFATLVPIAEHAIAQSDPYAALNDLVTTYGEAEIACVAAYLHDLGLKQAGAAPGSAPPTIRVTVTTEWLRRAQNRGFIPSNYAGNVN